MKGLLFLLYCIQILGAHLCGAQVSTQSDPRVSKSLSTASLTVSPSASNSRPEKGVPMTTASPKGVALVSTDARTSHGCTPKPTPTPQPTIFDVMFNRKECLPVLMVTGGLIIGCAILLVSTMLLAWKVCQLSRRFKALSSNAELISTSEYWTEGAKKNKSKSEAEPNETAVLMADLSQTQEATGAAKEEAGKVNGDGQMGEENKKEAGNAASGEETSTTPAAAAENSTTSEIQETTESQPTKAEASTSEGTEDVV